MISLDNMSQAEYEALIDAARQFSNDFQAFQAASDEVRRVSDLEPPFPAITSFEDLQDYQGRVRSYRERLNAAAQKKDQLKSAAVESARKLFPLLPLYVQFEVNGARVWNANDGRRQVSISYSTNIGYVQGSLG